MNRIEIYKQNKTNVKSLWLMNMNRLKIEIYKYKKQKRVLWKGHDRFIWTDKIERMRQVDRQKWKSGYTYENN